MVKDKIEKKILKANSIESNQKDKKKKLEKEN
jgi:hypothetical protein